MKNKKRLIITLVTILCFAVSQIVFAAEVSEINGEIEKVDQEVNQDVNTDVYNSEDKAKPRENANFGLKVASEAIQLQKIGFETAKDALEKEKDELENAKDDLEKQYEEAKAAGNLELAQQLSKEIQEIKGKIVLSRQQIKNTIQEMRAVIKNTYTTEEQQQLKRVADKLKAENGAIKVLPVESVMVKGSLVKFDTPPVIKGGRTLIPVRAVIEAFGADVKWDAVEKKVTITKDDKVIVIQIGSNVAYVNGVEVKLDVESETVNGRTIVPLRFIGENLGVNVNWDSETETIEIEEENK